jgi:hypothetical protein
MELYRKTRRKARGGALSRDSLPLFDWAQSQGLLEHPPVRHLVRQNRLSPALALVYAELSGLGGRA